MVSIDEDEVLTAAGVGGTAMRRRRPRKPAGSARSGPARKPASSDDEPNAYETADPAADAEINVNAGADADGRTHAPAPQSTVRGLLRNTFGFDLRSLALWRILVGAIVIADLYTRWQAGIAAHYTDDGVLPRSVLVDRSGSWNIDVYLMARTEQEVMALFLVQGLAGLALLVGWYPNVACGLCWFMVTSLQNRNRLVNNAGDSVLRLMLFWGTFLPLGKRFSIESWRPTGLRSSDSSRGRHGDGLALAPATVALTFQVCVIYVFTGVLKVQDSRQQYVLRCARCMISVFFFLLAHPTGSVGLIYVGRALCVLLQLV